MKGRKKIQYNQISKDKVKDNNFLNIEKESNGNFVFNPKKKSYAIQFA